MVGRRLGSRACVSSLPALPLQPSMNDAVARNLERPVSPQWPSLPPTAQDSPFLIGRIVRVDATKTSPHGAPVHSCGLPFLLPTQGWATRRTKPKVAATLLQS